MAESTSGMPLASAGGAGSRALSSARPDEPLRRTEMPATALFSVTLSAMSLSTSASQSSSSGR